MVFSSLLSTVSTSIPGQVPAPWSSGLIGGHMKESSCPKLGGVGMSRTFDEVPASPQAANVLPSLMLAEEGDQAATHWGRRLSEAVEQQQDVCMGCSGSDAAEAPGTWQEFCDGFSRWLINEDAAVDRHVELKVHGKGKWDGYFAEAERRCFDWLSEEEIRPVWVLQSNYGTFSREIVSRPKVQTAVIRQSADGDNAHQGAAESSSYYEHVLLPADTLQSLALTYNTTVHDICFANGVYGSKHSLLLVRKKLRIPRTHGISTGGCGA